MDLVLEIKKDHALICTSFELERAEDPVRITMWASANKDFSDGQGVFIRLARKELERFHTELGYYLALMKEKGY